MTVRENMFTHETSSLEFREGFREGMNHAQAQVEELIEQLKMDNKVEQAAWLEVARDWIDDECSMYEVGDEE